MNTDYDPPAVGDVWSYPYLWARQAKSGETEGRKTRPCALILLLRQDDGRTLVVLLAITTQPPLPGQTAIEVPQIERRRAGLDVDRPLWVIVDERNEDVLPGSYDFEPGGRIGRFGAAFTSQLRRAKMEAIRSRRSRRVPRQE
ncbi:hypothetical protein [Jannaschia marina]|uniref:hypothetical protein n=1 Tax=Jannaschia marina TaxID=2741674 RepID=UPI0015CE3057|nr:hypothetical protein [Jannaschia marina]